MTQMEFSESLAHQHIRTLEHQRYTHLLQADTEAYAQLCHPELSFLHSTGKMEGLESFLAPIRHGLIRYHWVDHPVRSITVIGATAVVTGDVKAGLSVRCEQVVLQNRIIATWVYDKEDWLLLSHAGVAVPQQAI